MRGTSSKFALLVRWLTFAIVRRSSGQELNAGVTGTRQSAWDFRNAQEILESDTLTGYGASISLNVGKIMFAGVIVTS